MCVLSEDTLATPQQHGALKPQPFADSQLHTRNPFNIPVARHKHAGIAAEDLDRQLGNALLSLALAAGGRPATLRQLSAALHVVGWGAGAPASQALALAFLAGTAGTACAPGLLALLGRFLGDDQEAAARPDRAAALLIAFPLVHLASLAADAGARAWAAGVLKRVAGLQCPLLPVTESLNPNAHPKAQPACRSIPAPRPWARYAVALEALRALWRGSREAARGWLVALRTHAGACGQSPPSLPVGMLCALLRHLDVETCEEALRTLAALAGPGAGGTAVVLLAQLLRALREETRAGPAMAMLRQLPALGKHTEALPFVLLSLQRLFHPGGWRAGGCRRCLGGLSDGWQRRYHSYFMMMLTSGPGVPADLTHPAYPGCQSVRALLPQGVIHDSGSWALS